MAEAKPNIYHILKYDLPASVALFFVAVPLCLGISIASGAPEYAGLIAGILGGMLVGLLSGSQTSVSGPAAGMVAVVLSSVEKLGSYEAFTLALAAGGLIQVLAGFSRMGFISSFIPKNVIRGLLVAIGIILILKQIPHALGLDSSYEGDFSFFQEDGENTFTELWRAVSFVTPSALLVSGISIAILVFWPSGNTGLARFIPAYLVVVIAGVSVNSLLAFCCPDFAISDEHLVSLPRFSALSRLMPQADFDILYSPSFWRVAITIALVASLETLLNLEAADNLDPLRRISPSNKELVAQGAGNFVAGIFGGIPITSVIVRTSVSINSGSQTKWATILHGFWLLAGFLFFTDIINLIPYASLAGILIISGYKLARVEIFTRMYRMGWAQFIPFLFTVTAIILSDLLTGVLLGALVSIFYLLKTSLQIPLLSMDSKKSTGDVLTLTLPSQVSFLNKARIKRILRTIPKGEKLSIDASEVQFMDADVKEIFRDFISNPGIRESVLVNYHPSQEADGLPAHVEFTEVLDKEGQSALKPLQILDLLRAGNSRFVSGKMFRKHFGHQVMASSASQSPMAAIISCIDSRTSPDIIFDAGLGDLLSIRIAGNIITPEIAGSVELALRELGVRAVIILAHSNCGAIGQALSGNTTGNVSLIVNEIRLSAGAGRQSEELSSPGMSESDRLSLRNLHHSVARIKELSIFVREKLDAGEIVLAAGFYETRTGKVDFLPPEWKGRLVEARK